MSVETLVTTYAKYREEDLKKVTDAFADLGERRLAGVVLSGERVDPESWAALAAIRESGAIGEVGLRVTELADVAPQVSLAVLSQPADPAAISALQEAGVLVAALAEGADPALAGVIRIVAPEATVGLAAELGR